MGWTELLRLPKQVPIGLRLVGGETLLSSTAFHMTPRRVEGDRQEWIVHQVDRKGQRTEIAEFANTAGTVEFRWRPDCEIRLADQLRNALLEIAVGSHNVLLPLRQAVVAAPLALAGPKGSGQIEVRIETLPEISRLRLELTRSTGTSSFAKKFESPVAGPEQRTIVDVGAGELAYPLEVHVSFGAESRGTCCPHPIPTWLPLV